MKKAYSKPEVTFEDFNLTTSIASGCEFTTNLSAQNECGLDFSGLIVFMTGMAGCADGVQIPPTAPGGDGEYVGICYNVPQGQNLFAS